MSVVGVDGQYILKTDAPVLYRIDQATQNSLLFGGQQLAQVFNLVPILILGIVFGIDPPIVDEIQLRQDPKLLAATDFEGPGVTGLFAFYEEDRVKELIRRTIVDDE